MRQLHLVGVTADHTGLLVTEQRDATADTFILPINDELRAALASARSGYGTGPSSRGGSRARFVSSALSPRDIQARLRLGRSVEEIATEAGVGTDWIERFAGPIVAEQQAALRRALVLVYSAPRYGFSARPLGASVTHNLLVRGLRFSSDEMAERWSAALHADSEWIVSFRYLFRQREVEARWVVDFDIGSVVAVNRAAASLAYVAPPAPQPVPAKPSARPDRQPRLPGVAG